MNHESQPVEPNSALKLLKLPLGYIILHKRDLVLKAGTAQTKVDPYFQIRYYLFSSDYGQTNN